MKLKQCLRVSALLVAASSTAFATSASAGGLYIWEFGQPNQGASGAGAGALALDASTVFMNPAGITWLEQPERMATGIIIDSTVKFSQDPAAALRPPAVPDGNGERPAGNGGDAGSTALGAAFAFAKPVNDKWGWGISVASISGAAMEYEAPRDFAGRYWGTEVELLTINVTPAISYRVNDNLSLGFGLPVMFGTLDLNVAIPGPLEAVPDGLAEIKDGEDFELTFSLSALWQATPRLRLGAMYLHEIDISFDSDLSLNLPNGASPGDISADVAFTYPSTVRSWGAYELNDRITLLGTLAWEEWSSFESLAISTPMGGGALPRNWEDTWHYGFGFRASTSGPWAWYTGIAYDESPTNPANRTADMPIDEQMRFSVGATYEKSNGHKVGVSVTYADYGDAAIVNGGLRPVSGLPWTVQGSYSSNEIIFAGLNYTW